MHCSDAQHPHSGASTNLSGGGGGVLLQLRPGVRFRAGMLPDVAEVKKRLTLPIAAAATGQGCLPWLQPTRPDPQVAVATLANKAARFIIAYVHYTAGLAATLEGDGRCGRNDTTNVLLELTAPACVLQADGACAAAAREQAAAVASRRPDMALPQTCNLATYLCHQACLCTLESTCLFCSGPPLSSWG